MTPQLIAIDANALDRLESRLANLERMLMGATITPAPQWVSITDAADRMKVSTDTIRRWVASGRMEAEGAGKARRVKLAR